MIQIAHTSYHPEMSMDEFIKLEDKDLQHFLFNTRRVVRSRSEIKSSEDDDKKGWYMVHATIRRNNQGTMYKHSTIKEYIVYDKKTKKGRVSPVHRGLLLTFLKEYFRYPELIMDNFIWKITPTLCKKIVEGKIHTIEDIIKYHRSYTIKNKSLDLATVYRFSLWKQFPLLNVIEDPENATLEKLQSTNIDLYNMPFKFKMDEIPKLGAKYDRWTKEQNKKYDSLCRQRDEKYGNSTSQESISEGTIVFGTLSPEF